MSPAQARVLTGAATVVPLLGIALSLVQADGNWLVHAACLFAPAIAWVVLRKHPSSPVAPALAWSSAAVSLVQINDVLAASWYTADPLPLAGVARHVWAGLWPVNLAGLFTLLLVFPDGRRKGRYWATLPFVFATAVLLMVFSLWNDRQVGGEVVGEGVPAQAVANVVSTILIAACLISAVVSVVRQYRSADQRRALQIRWLLLAGTAVVLLLMGGWVAEALGASLALAYTPFLLAIVVLVPAAVGVAMVRHDLFDIDRILGVGWSWALTLLVSAVIFGGVVLAISRSLGEVGGFSQPAAAFVTALMLLPLHRYFVALVGRVIDPDRHIAVAQVERFAADVRSGSQPPENIEQVLRQAQGDPDLQVILRHPDGRWVRMSGEPVPRPDGIAVEVGGDTIAVVTLGWTSARAVNRITALTRAAWVTIEVSRLRSVLREALVAVVASQARLDEAAAAERSRLERDLHDGAQQRIVATGMRLRILQRHLSGDAENEVETAVAELEQTVRELRDIAHGVRPVRLSDGLGPALETVRTASPVPVTLSVHEPHGLDERRRLTAYLVVSEAVTNALKHADASSIDVSVADEGGKVALVVRDDGIGGVPGTGLTSLRDRVQSVGGHLDVDSPVGVGTTVTVSL